MPSTEFHLTETVKASLSTSTAGSVLAGCFEPKINHTICCISSLVAVLERFLGEFRVGSAYFEQYLEPPSGTFYLNTILSNHPEQDTLTHGEQAFLQRHHITAVHPPGGRIGELLIGPGKVQLDLLIGMNE